MPGLSTLHPDLCSDKEDFDLFKEIQTSTFLQRWYRADLVRSGYVRLSGDTPIGLFSILHPAY